MVVDSAGGGRSSLFFKHGNAGGMYQVAAAMVCLIKSPITWTLRVHNALDSDIVNC